MAGYTKIWDWLSSQRPGTNESASLAFACHPATGCLKLCDTPIGLEQGCRAVDQGTARADGGLGRLFFRQPRAKICSSQRSLARTALQALVAHGREPRPLASASSLTRLLRPTSTSHRLPHPAACLCKPRRTNKGDGDSATWVTVYAPCTVVDVGSVIGLPPALIRSMISPPARLTAAGPQSPAPTPR